MCYMESVGVRELRQNASVLLQKVERGASIEITNHGHAVARLVPIGTPSRRREDLIVAGVLRPGRGTILDIEPVALPADSPGTSVLLAELRDDR